MDVSKLQGAQSFQVRTVQGKLDAEQLKGLEHNGKVDIVIEDKEKNQTHILSGEKIEINEYNQRMGSADPNFKMGAYFNADLKPLKHMDRDSDGFLVESETRHTAGEAWGDGFEKAGTTISDGAELGSIYGTLYGSKVPVLGSAIGGFVGGFVGGVAGLVSSPFKGVGHALSKQGSQIDVQTWNLTDNLKAIR